MKQIKLYGKHGEGKIALVDDADYAIISAWRWYVDNKGYSYREKSGNKRVFMPQLIMGKYPIDKPEIDHLNANKLDNRRENLRFCTSGENRQNRRKYQNNKSGFLGIFWHKQGKKWMARIHQNKKPIYLGLFSNLQDAKKAVKKAKS